MLIIQNYKPHEEASHCERESAEATTNSRIFSPGFDVLQLLVIGNDYRSKKKNEKKKEENIPGRRREAKIQQWE